MVGIFACTAFPWYNGAEMKRLLLLATLFVLAVSCQGSFTPEATPSPTPPKPSPHPVAEAFLAAWEERAYTSMYGFLSSPSKATVSEEKFIERYEGVMEEATVTSLSVEVTRVEEKGTKAEARFLVTLRTVLLGEFLVENTLPLVWEEGWKVEWSPSLIFPDLSDENLVYLERELPARANIYARNGEPLAIEGALVVVGVIPGQIQDEPRLLSELSRILGMSQGEISEKYHTVGIQPHWWVPIGDITFEESIEYRETLSSLAGVSLREKPIRTYPQGTVAAHIVGYVGEIDQEELASLSDEGYRDGDRVGKTGLERWGEGYLAGRMGGVLSVVTPQGEVVKVIREYLARPSRSIYTTIDLGLQRVAEEALGDKTGAIVALDPYSGEILAMVSHPTFDPNPLIRGLDASEWQALLGDPGRPLLNRATQGAYPTGSVFKIVTAAAALTAPPEGAGFDPSFTIQCTGSWRAPWGRVYTDWAAHGPRDFFWAIVRSCDVFFFQMGLSLNSVDPWLLPRFGHKLGFGELTGIEVDETEGLVPDPAWKEVGFTGVGNPFWVPGDAVNLAVGQGDLLATPLQVANMMAAIANGGTLYRPHLVLRLGATPRGEEEVFEPAEIGKLPLSPEHLQLIQEALREVAMNPRGTAYYTFKDSPFPVAGKTGTAEAPPGNPHAWFAGYAPADDPQIAVAVVVEHGGEGSVAAAPILRKVVEAYLLPPETESD